MRAGSAMDSAFDADTVVDSLDDVYSLHGGDVASPDEPEPKRQRQGEPLSKSFAWVPVIVEALGTVLERLRVALPSRIQTGCSGTGAPVTGLKATRAYLNLQVHVVQQSLVHVQLSGAKSSNLREACGIPILEEFACDKKQASHLFLESNGPPQHLYDNLKMITEATSAFCMRHQTFCPPAKNADLYIIGPPCSPFSGQRVERWAKGCTATRVTRKA
eukprot:6490434-Amphidinium_carterae.6